MMCGWLVGESDRYLLVEVIRRRENGYPVLLHVSSMSVPTPLNAIH